MEPKIDIDNLGPAMKFHCRRLGVEMEMSPGPPWTVTLRCLSRSSLSTAAAKLSKVCVCAHSVSLTALGVSAD